MHTYINGCRQMCSTSPTLLAGAPRLRPTHDTDVKCQQSRRGGARCCCRLGGAGPRPRPCGWCGTRGACATHSTLLSECALAPPLVTTSFSRVSWLCANPRVLRILRQAFCLDPPPLHLKSIGGCLGPSDTGHALWVVHSGHPWGRAPVDPPDSNFITTARSSRRLRCGF